LKLDYVGSLPHGPQRVLLVIRGFTTGAPIRSPTSSGCTCTRPAVGRAQHRRKTQNPRRGPAPNRCADDLRCDREARPRLIGAGTSHRDNDSFEWARRCVSPDREGPPPLHSPSVATRIQAALLRRNSASSHATSWDNAAGTVGGDGGFAGDAHRKSGSRGAGRRSG